MERHYLKLSNQNFFSPHYVRGYSSGGIRSRKIIPNFPKTTKFSSNTINDFYSSKNRSDLLISSNNFKLYSPKQNIIKKNYRNIRSSRPKLKSSSFQKILPSVGKNITQNKFCLETEKLYHETYQIKKVIKQLEQELFYLSQENIIKDEQLNEKEQEINSIINNNYKTFDDDRNSDNYNINISDVNSSMGVLILKIKKEIRNTNNEIKNENFKLNYLKRSLYLTKIKELNIESKILLQQFNKINILIDNALEIKNENDKTMEEYDNLKENINRQEIILSSLNNECISLEQEEYFLNNQLQNLKNELKTKIEKAKKNNNELNALSIKNKNLNNDKIIKSQSYTTKINGMPITIKSLYTNKLSNLKKNINFYKRQCKYTEDMINKLQDQRKKLIDVNKNSDQKLKISQNFLQNSTKLKKMNRPQSSIGSHKVVLKDEDIINNLKEKYKSVRENEVELEHKATTYFEKLVEIDKESEEKEKEQEENQIEFGIDENNPYYTDNEENVPESQIKFTSSQFNQFTYILFKNFEAKFIVAEEANNKIINPFYDFVKKDNITKVNYPSKEFDNIIEEFTKIIMKELKSDNEYNHTLTKMFIGALLYNSECDTNKLIEYFSILFSYTRNYILEEKKFIEKLKTKYKNQTKKLVECITSYILNDLSSSPYFSLFKMKDLLDKNEINLKDKYIEFLFYYMKKFSDPDAKLEDLKFSLLNDIVPIGDTTVHSKAFINDIDKDIDLDNNLEDNFEDNLEQKDNKETGIENNIEKEEKNNKEMEKEEKINEEMEKKEKNNKEIEKKEKINKENEKKEKINKVNEEINKDNNNNNNYNIEVQKKGEEYKEIEHQNDSKKNILNKSNNNEMSEHSKKEANISDENNFDIDQNEIKQIKDDNINNHNKVTDKSNNSKNNNNNINNIHTDKKRDEINEQVKNLENNIDKKNENQENEKKNEENDLNRNDNKNNSTDKYIDNEINKIDNDKFNKLNQSNDKNSIDKFMDKSLKKGDENNNSENNQNNEPVLNNETEKEEIIETGNYENKEKKETNKSKDKEDKKNEPKKSKIEKYKEEEYAINTNNDEENKEKEDEKKYNDNINGNNDTNLNEADDSVTEITNEEYKKQIIESINLIQNALKKKYTDFNSLMENVINKKMIEGKMLEYINIEDFNEKLISIDVTLTDLQLSCLCSKYSIPNELRLIDKNKFEENLNDYLDGILKIE